MTLTEAPAGRPSTVSITTASPADALRQRRARARARSRRSTSRPTPRRRGRHRSRRPTVRTSATGRSSSSYAGTATLARRRPDRARTRFRQLLRTRTQRDADSRRTRALAVTAGASLLLLLALGGQAHAAKSTKTVNATSHADARSSTRRRTLPKQRRVRRAPRRSCCSRARRRRSVARSSRARPCAACPRIARRCARRRSARGQGQEDPPSCAQTLAALGPASLKASRKLLSDRRDEELRRRHPVEPTIKATNTSILRERRERHDVCASSCPRCAFASPGPAAASRWTQLVLPEHRQPRCRPARPASRSPRSTFAVPDGATLAVGRGRRSPTRSTASTSSRPSRETGRPGAGRASAPKPNFLAPAVLRHAASSSTPRLRHRRAGPRRAGVRHRPRPGPRPAHRRPALPGRAVQPEDRQAQGAHAVDVKVTFDGGTKTFTRRARLAVGDRAEPARRRPAERSASSASSSAPIVYQPCGEELLVITNPSTLAAANTYATARARRGLPDARRPDRRGAGPDRHDAGADPDLHPRPAQPPVLHPPELRDDHRRRRARADVHDRPRRDPVRQPVLDEERRRRAAGRRDRPHARQHRRADRRAAREDHPLRDRAADGPDAQQGDRRGAVPGHRRRRRGQRRPGGPHVHPVRREGAQRPRRARRRRRPHLRGQPDDDPAEVQRRHRPAGVAEEADVPVGRRRRRRQRGVEPGPLHGRAPRPRLVRRLGRSVLHDDRGRRADELQRHACRSC